MPEKTLPEQNIPPSNVEPLLGHILEHSHRAAATNDKHAENALVQSSRNGTLLERSVEAQGRILADTGKIADSSAKTADGVTALAEKLAPQEIADSAVFHVKGVKGDQGIQGIPGEKGEKGEQGVQGFQGEQGVQGFQGIPGEKGDRGDSIKGDRGKDGENGTDGKHGKDGRDGKDGSPDTPDQIISKIKKLISYDDLDPKSLPNLEAFIRRISSKTVSLSELDDVNLGGLTKTGGKYNLGSGSGSGGTTPTGFVDNEIVSGAGTAWTLAAVPVAGTQQIYANGQRLTVGVDYTISGASITTTDSWSGGTILADYFTSAQTGFVENEVIAGSATAWTLANTPIVASQHVFANGQRLIPGGIDYTISGSSIITIQSWSAGTLLSDYRH